MGRHIIVGQALPPAFGRPCTGFVPTWLRDVRVAKIVRDTLVHREASCDDIEYNPVAAGFVETP